jgi:hypothetical protein
MNIADSNVANWTVIFSQTLSLTAIWSYGEQILSDRQSLDMRHSPGVIALGGTLLVCMRYLS